MRSLKHPRMADISLEGVLAALGDPVRFAMVRKLAHCPNSNLNCASVAEKLDNLPPSTRTHHLRILREAGLIESTRQGVQVLNRLRQDELEKRFPGLLEAILTQRS